MHEIECEGKSVSEAVEAALKKLGLRREQVEVKIMQEAKQGFMGFGSQLAKVKVGEKKWVGQEPQSSAAPARERASAPRTGETKTRREKPAAAAKSAATQKSAAGPKHAVKPAPESGRAPGKPEQDIIAQTLSQLLGLMQCQAAKIDITWEQKQERLKASITGVDAELLIGEDGKVLYSLQMITNLVMGRKKADEDYIPVQIDAMGWREKKERDILERLDQAIEDVKRTGKPYRLEPMDAATRRVIHKQLADHPDIVTASEGEGTWRKIVIRPRNNS